MSLLNPPPPQVVGGAWRRMSAAVTVGLKQARGLRRFLAGLPTLVPLAFRPSLRTIVDRTVREHFRRNAALKPYRTSPLRRVMVVTRAHPVASMGILVLAYAAACSLTLFVSPETFSLRPHGDRAELQTINIGILSAQAALVALVYPLVIAFIGVLFEPRTARGSRMEVFLSETEAVATGGSALLLCGASSVFLVAMGHMPVRFSFAITVLNSAWFAGNLVGTAFFVARSIAYVRPSSRPALLRNFAAVSAWSDDLRSMATWSQAAEAVRHGHLRGVRYVRPNTATETLLDFEVTPFTLSGDSGSAAVVLAADSRLLDLRFGWLEMAGHAWAVRNAATTASACEGNVRLRVRICQGGAPSGPLALAEVKNGPPLGRLEQRLARHAYRFAPAGRDRRREPARTASLVGEMAAELLPLIETGRVFEFEAQLDSLVDLHIFLFEIAAVPGDEARSNYAQSDSPFLLMGTLGDDWARGYRDVIHRTAAKLPAEPGFFHLCAYLAASLHGRLAPVAGQEALLSISRLAMTVVSALRAWADGLRRRATGAAGGPGTIWELAGADGEVHQRAWRELVAGWERYGQAGRMYRTQASGLTPAEEWEQLAAGSGHLLAHLASTAEIVGGCAFAGDLLGVNWSVDVLLKWKEANLAEQLGAVSHWPIDSLLITPDLVATRWEDGAVRVPEMSSSPGANATDLYMAVIGNAWLDAQFALACILVRWAGGSSPDGAAALAARNLFRRVEFDSTGSAPGSREPLTMRDFLACGIRVTVSLRPDGWGAKVASLMDSIARVEDRPMVSLRHYVSNGTILDAGGTVHEQSICLLALSRGDCAMDGGIGQAITMVCAGEDLAARRLVGFFGDLRQALNALDEVVHGPTVAAVRGEPATDFVLWRDCAVRLVSECLSSLVSSRTERLQAAPVDPVRLGEVAAAASSLAFSESTGGSPICLFERVALVSGAAEPYRLTSRVERGLLTLPLMSDGVRTDAGWWAKEMRRAAAAVVMSDVVRLADKEEVVIADTAAFWEVLRRASASGLTMFLFVGPSRHMGWLRGWDQGPPHVPVAVPTDFTVVTPRVRMADGHVLDVNGIAVFRSSWFPKSSLLMPRTILASVEFTDFGKGRAADAAYDDDDPPGDEGLLTVRFERRVRLDGGTVHVLSEVDATE